MFRVAEYQTIQGKFDRNGRSGYLQKDQKPGIPGIGNAGGEKKDQQ